MIWTREKYDFRDAKSRIEFLKMVSMENGVNATHLFSTLIYPVTIKNISVKNSNTFYEFFDSIGKRVETLYLKNSHRKYFKKVVTPKRKEVVKEDGNIQSLDSMIDELGFACCIRINNKPISNAKDARQILTKIKKARIQTLQSTKRKLDKDFDVLNKKIAQNNALLDKFK